jgi:thiol:disulfide interchange protein DsbD
MRPSTTLTLVEPANAARTASAWSPRPACLPGQAPEPMGELAAAGLAGAGVLLGAFSGSFHGASTLTRIAKGAGVALVVGGIVYAAGASSARSRAGGDHLAWSFHQDELAAIAHARAQGKPVIIDFWADWCTACKELDKTAWADPRVQAAAGRFVKGPGAGKCAS